VSIAIRPLTRDRLPELARVLSLAFVDDPMLRWPLPPGDDIRERIELTFGSIYEGIVDAGVIWEAGDADGFAVWIPAGTTDAMFESDAAARDRIAALTDDGAARYGVLWAWIEAHTPDDVWYLDCIGVDPARQGDGVGTALVRFGLERAVEGGTVAFLETAVEGNVAYYERFGFRVVDQGEPAEGGPHIWFMRSGG
jgi:ribosomal protein S18 acetylase RimI-like enzyme